jgi:hypothetical protein
MAILILCTLLPMVQKFVPEKGKNKLKNQENVENSE